MAAPSPSDWVRGLEEWVGSKMDEAATKMQAALLDQQGEHLDQLRKQVERLVEERLGGLEARQRQLEEALRKLLTTGDATEQPPLRLEPLHGPEMAESARPIHQEGTEDLVAALPDVRLDAPPTLPQRHSAPGDIASAPPQIMHAKEDDATHPPLVHDRAEEHAPEPLPHAASAHFPVFRFKWTSGAAPALRVDEHREPTPERRSAPPTPQLAPAPLPATAPPVSAHGGAAATAAAAAARAELPPLVTDTEDSSPAPRGKMDEDSEPDLPSIEHAAAKSQATLRKVGWYLLVLVLPTPLLVSLYAFPLKLLPALLVLCMWLLYWSSNQYLIRVVSARASTIGRKRSVAFRVLARVLRAGLRMRRSKSGERRIKGALYVMTVCFIVSSSDVLPSLHARYGSRNVSLMILACAATGMAFRQACRASAPGGRLSRCTSDDFGEGSESVRSAIRDLRESLRKHKRQGRSWDAEQSVLGLFTEYDREMLNAVLEQMPVELFQAILYTFRQTVHLLCFDLVDSLAPRAKANLIDVLMSMQDAHSKDALEAVENLLMSTHGDDLSELKCIQDGRGNVHSMRNLLFTDIVDQAMQQRILNHFLAEAMSQVAHRTLLATGHFRRLLLKARRWDCVREDMKFVAEADERPEGPSYSGHRFRCSWRKIMFDVDDTLQCSGGPPAGVDKRYPKHTVYPGFIAFLKELHRGDEMGQMVALSARPDFLEQDVVKRFKKLQLEHGLHALPTLLLGEIETGWEFLVKGGDEGMRALAKTKYKRVHEYISVYPEFKFIFFGDNGQGDFTVAHMMHEKFPDNLEQVWIHKVQDVPATPFYNKYKDRSGAPIEFVEDYVMAAVRAFRRPSPLITAEGLARVVEAAVKDFLEITDWRSDEQRKAEEVRLSKSIRFAQVVLAEAGEVSSVSLEHTGDELAPKALPDAPALLPSPPAAATASGGRSLLSWLPRGPHTRGGAAAAAAAAVATAAPAPPPASAAEAPAPPPPEAEVPSAAADEVPDGPKEPAAAPPTSPPFGPDLAHPPPAPPAVTIPPGGLPASASSEFQGSELRRRVAGQDYQDAC